MRITDDQIRKFQEIYQNHFNSEIAFDSAKELGGQLIELIRMVNNK